MIEISLTSDTQNRERGALAEASFPGERKIIKLLSEGDRFLRLRFPSNLSYIFLISLINSGLIRLRLLRQPALIAKLAHLTGMLFTLIQ